MVQAEPNVNIMEIDATWRQFLHTKVNSFIKWDLVRFFHDNPYTVETAENIAHFVGRDVQAIQTELLELASAGVLIATQRNTVTTFSLTKEKHMRELLRNFMDACLDRSFRVKAIQTVIDSMGSNYAR
jgi:hypothetical protein